MLRAKHAGKLSLNFWSLCLQTPKIVSMQTLPPKLPTWITGQRTEKVHQRASAGWAGTAFVALWWGLGGGSASLLKSTRHMEELTHTRRASEAREHLCPHNCTPEESTLGAHQGGHATTRPLGRILRRVLETTFEKVLMRVLGRGLRSGI